MTSDTIFTTQIHHAEGFARFSTNQIERGLLLLAALFVGVTQFGFLLASGQRLLDGYPLVVWLLCAFGAHLMLCRVLPHRDPLIFPIVMLFCGWGLVLIERLAPPFAAKQTLWLIVSALVLWGVVSRPLHLRWLQRYRYVWLFGGLALLGATIVVGRNPAGFGPRLWLGLFDAYFQPSELLKVLLLVFLASYLAEQRDLLIDPARSAWRKVRVLVPLIVMWGISAVLLVLQRDLGTATLFYLVFLAVLYVATGDWRIVLAGLVIGVGGVLLGYRALVSLADLATSDNRALAELGRSALALVNVVRLRVGVWWNPWPNADDQAYQIVQSLLAFAAGGVFGQGVGQGSPTYIPVVHSDFAFAAVAEEWGLLGTLCVVLLAAIFAMRALRLAVQLESNPFRALLAAGIGITYSVQSLLIMGGTLKLIPLTGVTLPFLSYGGSSLLANFMMVGLLLVLSHRKA